VQSIYSYTRRYIVKNLPTHLCSILLFLSALTLVVIVSVPKDEPAPCNRGTIERTAPSDEVAPSQQKDKTLPDVDEDSTDTQYVFTPIVTIRQVDLAEQQANEVIAQVERIFNTPMTTYVGPLYAGDNECPYSNYAIAVLYETIGGTQFHVHDPMTDDTMLAHTVPNKPPVKLKRTHTGIDDTDQLFYYHEVKYATNGCVFLMHDTKAFEYIGEIAAIMDRFQTPMTPQ
jgi:hypothetical protein